MKISLSTLIAAALFSLTTAAAHGTMIVDTNFYGTGPSGQVISNGAALTDSWSLLPFGYTPGADIITSATASFTLLDNNSANFYSIVWDGAGSLTGSNFSGTFTFGENILGISLAQLSSTGVLSYTIRNTSNANPNAPGPRFRIQSATLTAEVSSPTATGVPEGGATATLLGLGIAGIAVFRARLA